MVRIFEKTALALLTVLVNHTQNGGSNFTNELAGAARRTVENLGGYKMFGDNAEAIKEALYQTSVDRNAPKVTELQHTLAKGIFRGGEDPAYDQTLVDTIARILRLPYAANRLTGPTIAELSDVILRPDEKLADAAKKFSSVRCYKCGDELADTQMVTFYTGAAMDGEAALFCQVCAPPSYLKCSGKDCFSKVEYLPNSKTPIHEVKCHDCTRGRTPQVVQDELAERHRALGYTNPAPARRGGMNRVAQAPNPANLDEMNRLHAEMLAAQNIIQNITFTGPLTGTTWGTVPVDPTPVPVEPEPMPADPWIGLDEPDDAFDGDDD